MADETLIRFCPQCFADEGGGSWGEAVYEGGCANCGMAGSGVLLPSWAIKSIREQASWVGKRYYPHEEDRENAVEREALRKVAPRPVGRFVMPAGDPGSWWVQQLGPDGRMTGITVQAPSSAEAFVLGLTQLRWHAPETLTEALAKLRIPDDLLGGREVQKAPAGEAATPPSDNQNSPS